MVFDYATWQAAREPVEGPLDSRLLFPEPYPVHERIRITQFHAGFDAKRNIVNFGGKLIRTADDAPRLPRQRDFKGAADCRAGHSSLIVWSTA